VLIADTAVPAWRESYETLPVVFGASALASAAGVAIMLAPAEATGPAGTALRAAATLELAAVEDMIRKLGPLAEPYHRGRAASWAKAARALTGTGLVLTSTVRTRWPFLARLGGAAVVGGGLCMRVAVVEAGRESALDPGATAIANAG